MLRLTLLIYVLTSTPAFALYHGRVIASDTTDPIEVEIARRTVRVEVAAGECSGVLLNATTARTAGHCFALGGGLVGVRLQDGALVKVPAKVRYVTPPRLFANASSPDQAEIKFERGISPVNEIATLDPRHLTKTDHLIVSGFGPTNESNVDDDDRPLSYVYATLQVHRVWGLYSLRKSYELHPEDDEVFFTDGDSGGPAFVERNGTLRLIGNVSGDPKRRSEGLRPAVIRPIGDLKH